MNFQIFYNKIRDFIKKIPSTILIILIIQTGFIILFHRRNLLAGNLVFYFELIKTLVSITLIFFLITLLTGKLKISGGINISLIFIYSLLILYHYHSGASLDYLILAEFKSNILAPEVLVMIINYAGLTTALFLIILTTGLIFSQLKWKLFSSHSNSQKQLVRFIVLLLIMLLISVMPINSRDEITSFGKSIVGWNRIQTVFSDEDYKHIEQYPLVKLGSQASSIKNKSNLPNIIIVPIESFNAFFVEKKSNTGKEITPFFNSLISKGLYIENFYGNSVITVKGHLSILFSTLPSYRGLETEEYFLNNFQSLAAILKSTGYKTIFFQGSDNSSLKFQNEGPFLSRNGFDICKGIDDFPQNYSFKKSNSSYNFHNPKNEKGFGGYKDYVLYKQFFNTLDSLHSIDKEQKYFGFLSPYSGHGPWLRERGDTTIPFPNSGTIEEDFSNSLFRIDSYLKTFFNELRKRRYLDNTIIIITGDHSHPISERSKNSRGVSCYEEDFRVPFLLIWDKIITPERITDQRWSQTDIAPSILDLLNIDVTNHFLGISFFDKTSAEKNFIYLLQPFNKRYFCIIRNHYKYVYNVSEDLEYLFDLEKDPNELNNIVSDNDVELIPLREKVKFFGLNQYLLEHNRIWPKKNN
jgi:phosphoglycerol transferase MdoB-like AlkP superfamily enzyme